jgi:hypothetical protein
MEAGDLELVPTQQLINELVSRRTFLGVIIHSDKDCRNTEWGSDRNFRVHFNGNLDAAQVPLLLDRIAEYVTVHHL